MKTLALALGLSFFPVLSYAGIDFKCTDATRSEAVGLFRFDFNGSNGLIEIETWDGYPPQVVIEAKVGSATHGPKGATRLLTVPDLIEGAVATIDLPTDYIRSDKFEAKAVVRYVSPENRHLQNLPYNFTCIRQ
jgi:hypothetical protein